MRSALLCVFLALIIHNGSRASDSDFRPIPIPLDSWHFEKREGRVGTLHEAINTDAPPAVAAVPAHYWEDALRHSVYLTLVRDKIDQLIAKGVMISPNSKPEPHISKEVDDHDLWEKIKKAPFDRLQEDEHSLFGDVTVMAKGRLMEDNGGYRFTEDERSREDCSDDKCMEGVKAFWSVKRVRQRDAETSPGRYHYELTFSVNSQPPIKQRKPFENFVRTFTVRENAPDTVTGIPQEHPAYQPVRPQIIRPQRAVWVHKNIAPKQYINQGRFYNQGLDRIFSSFFSDDETHAESPPRYKPSHYMPPVQPMFSQYSKLGHVGLPSDQHQQKRLMPYPYKPHHMYRYRPPLLPPPVSNVQQHYIDVDVVKHPYIQQQSDQKYPSSSNIFKTTRPAVLPTPPSPDLNSTNVLLEINDSNTNISEETTKLPDFPPVHTTTHYKTHGKPRPPVKVNYFPEHIRPPVYNAPPGVFVTMDKKPFKPMPPLKYHHHHHHSSKPVKRPIDFRPSPQLIDGQLAIPDTEVESAFRPILLNNRTKDDDSSEDIEVPVENKNKNVRKPTSKKPPKKHENIKWPQTTTSAPEIITASNNEGQNDSEHEDVMHWMDVLSAFSKTTPMHSQSDKKPESTTEMYPLTTKKLKTTTTTGSPKETTSSTTAASALKKRTRPPHKFVKPEKVKKHKRVMSTTTTTTTTKAPEKLTLKKPTDLTPQASSAATHPPKSWNAKNKNTTTTTVPSTTTTTTITTTTTESSTTKQTSKSSPPLPLETTTTSEAIGKTPKPKNKNRFRLTTLMQKGTSLKHDRWSVTNITSDKKVTVPVIGKSPPRRKGSNFHGYTSPTSGKYNTKHENELQRETYTHGHDSMRSTTEPIIETTPTPTKSNNDNIIRQTDIDATSAYNQYQNKEEDEEDNYENDNQEIEFKTNSNDEQESADHSEFIFDATPSTPSEKTNEIIEEESIVTEQAIVASPKNKTRCKKKKKHDHLVKTTLIEEEKQATTTHSSVSTKPSSSGMDFIDELIGSLNYDETTEKPTDTKASKLELEEEESENHEKYLKIDEDFEEFLGNLGGKHGHSDEKGDVEYEDEDTEALPDDDDASPFDNEDINESEHSRDSNDKDYEDYRERSYSLLELMAME